MDTEKIAEKIKEKIPPKDWHNAKVWFYTDIEEIVRVVAEIITGKHQCSFGFGEGRKYSTEKGDWICYCGKTRREYLKESKH